MIGAKRVTKRQLQGIETRNKLFETAKDLFMQYGYETVSVDEIVERAGTSKGAFYSHFKSKDQIILEQFKEIDDFYLAEYEKIKRRRKARNQLLAFIKAQHYYISDILGISFIKTVYYSQIIKNDEDKAFINETRPLYTIVQEIIAEGQKNEEFRNDIEAVELTRMITRCMRGAIYDWCVRNGEFDLKADGYKFFLLILEALKPLKN